MKEQTHKWYLENVREEPERKKECPQSFRELRQVKVALPPETMNKNRGEKYRTVAERTRELVI